ncbi:Sec-independent protein translocase protein TatB [Methylobacillus flagellatus]
MLVIAVVALIVLGPDKLPKVARTCGMLYGRLQRYVSGFKQDMERELALDNMRKATAEAQQKLLALQAQLSEIHPESAGLAEVEPVSQASPEIQTEK